MHLHDHNNKKFSSRRSITIECCIAWACIFNGISVGFLQSGDGYLVGLATRYSTELRTNYGDVLQQLEDLRLAEWSDHAPPPPLAPGTTSNHSNEPVNHIRPTTSYVNYPRNDNEPIYVPGSYLVSNQYYLRF